MAIADQRTGSTARNPGSSGWTLGYAVLAVFVIATSIYFGQGLNELDPSQLVGP